MKLTKKKTARKLSTMMLALLMVISTFTPQLAYASVEKPKSFSEQELTLEKQREKAYETGEELPESTAKTRTGSEELTNLLNGLGIEPPPLKGETEAGTGDEKDKAANLLKAFEKEQEVNVIIRMKDKPDLTQIYPQVKTKKNRSEKIQTIQDHLKDKAKNSQKGIQQALTALESKGKGKQKDSLWIINGITASITIEALNELQKRDDIAEISLDETLSLPEVNVEENPPRMPQWGLEKIFAPQVWGEYGLKGEGIVVGIMDSGVDGNHEALKGNYRGRDGNHQYSWIDLSGEKYESPNDGYGHGTHVAGTAVGGGSGEPIGVAPEAEWIAAKIFNDGGSTTLSAIHQAFQWFMAPGGDPTKAPHVVNNSWGNSNAYNLEFYEDVKAWVSAGIFPSFAAGNDGPGSQTIGSPGSFPQTFAVGATDIFDQTASFSSRGPVFWKDENGQEQRIIKPDISAPGHKIYSAWPAKLNEGKYNTISGTSMATPHVSGAVALLLQANPNLTVDQVKELLKRTSRVEPHMGNLPNDSYGSGIMNIYQAVTEAAFAGELTGKLTNKDGKTIGGKLEIKEKGISYNIEDEGDFSFKIREGSHKVRITAFGYKDFETTIEIKKGEALTVNWVLENAQTFSLSGKVTDENGKAVPYAYVRVNGTPLPIYRTDSNGTFEVKNLPAGKYVLQLTGEGINGLPKEIEVDKDTSLELKVNNKTSTFNGHWGMANGNMHRNAVSANGIDLDALEKSWEYDASGKGKILFSTPAAATNKVVLVTDSGYVVALDSATGKEQWTVKIGNTNRSSPTIAGNTVYLSGGEDGKIYALDLKSGSIVWTTDVGSMAIYESPIFLDGTLFVASDLTDNAKLNALNAETGEKKWSVALGAPTYFGPSAGDGMLFIGSYDNQKLRALRIEDGSEVWNKTLVNEGVASKPVYDNGTLYLAGTNFNTGGGTLYALDAKTGEEIWNAEGIGDTQAGSPIVYENIVVIGSAAQPALRAFDAENGQLLWENRLVGTTLNNGSVSANGLLFFAGTSGNLSVIDVYTGERLKDFSLPVYSTSGIPILAGQVIVPYQTGVQSFKAPGTIKGALKDSGGKAVKGSVTVIETGESVSTDENGSFSLKHTPGDYTIRISSYGKKQITEKVKFASGYQYTKNYDLVDADKGSFSMLVKDKRTNQPLEGALIKFSDSPVEGKTSSDGSFTQEEVFEGNYFATVALNGYKPGSVEIVVKAGEKTEIKYELQPIDIAVLNDYKSEITSLLNVNGYIAEERGWDVVEDIGRYKVLYLNGSYGSDGIKPTEAQFKELAEKAKNNNVSIIFTDQWGANYGSIHHLKDFLQNPKELGHDYDGGEVRIQVEAEHPIFKGYKPGDRINVLENNADFAWFNQYSGRTIGKIGNTDQGFVGSGVAYNAVSEDSAHLLLSSHASVLWESAKGWLRGQQQILFNSIDFLYNAKFGKISGTVTNAAGEPVEANIEVMETGVKTQTDANGNFTIFHDPGVYKLEIRSKGLGSKSETVTVAKGAPANVLIALGESEKGLLTGLVTDSISGMELQDVNVAVKNEAGDLIAEVKTAANGRYQVSGLEEEVYEISFSKAGYIAHSQNVDVARHSGDLDIQLHTMPSVGVVGDYYSSDKNFKALFNELGVNVLDVQPADLVKRMAEFDVIFFNDPISSAISDEMMEAADKAQTSLIFGDAVWGGGIKQLVNVRKDPKELKTIRKTTEAAQYKVLEEHPIFNGSKVNDLIDILTPAASYVGYFKDYSGYPLAEIKHEGSDDTHGLGIAYKPRSAGSVELLMSGHGFAYYHGAKDYTEEGKQLLVNSVLWAANVNFPVVSGTVLDEEGTPLKADIKVKGQPFQTKSNSVDGSFSIAMLSGEYEIEISAFGYANKTIKVTAEKDSEPKTIQMEASGNIGSISGSVENLKDGNAVEGAILTVLDKPREAVTNVQGQYSISKIEPGDYMLRIEKEGYVRQDIAVKITDNQKASLKVKLRPSPTVGIIGDLTASGTTYKQYLEERGYKVLYLDYKDIAKLDEVDLVFANSDYKPDVIPSKEVFLTFQKALDEKRKSVIWTGQAGARGSIRYLQEFLNDPKTIYEHNNRPGAQGTVLAEHPLTSGFKPGETIAIPGKSGYYYGFDGYSGKTIVDFSHSGTGEKGSMVAYKGRTTDSVEILLANMTISHVFKPNDSFDPARERLLANALNWALDEKEALVGELHGIVMNESGPLKGTVTVTVKETGKSYQTDDKGKFFAALEEGTYTLTVEAFGHSAKDFTVTLKNGEAAAENFIIKSVDSGILAGKIVDTATKDPVPEARVEVIGTPVTVKANEEGKFQATLPAGSYEVKVIATGFKPVFQTVEIVTREQTEINVSLVVAEKIAVLANPYQKDKILPFLESNGYDFDFYPYAEYESLIENVPNYKLIIANDTSYYMKDDRFKAMVEKANENEVSIMFTAMFGGVIGDLRDAYGDPEELVNSYVDKEINLRVEESHPILKGLNKGDEVPFLLNPKGAVQYSVYKNYSGTTLATLTNPAKGDLGSTIGYKFSSSNSVHILLSALQIGNYGQPNDRWTENAKAIYLNAIDYALTASQGELKGAVVDSQGKPIAGALITIEGTSQKTTTNAAGQYKFGIGAGDYELKVQARGFAEQTKQAKVAELGSSVELNFTLEAIDGSDLNGMITGKKGKEPVAGASLTLMPKDDADFKMEIASKEDGTFTFENLLPGDYTMNVLAEGYLQETFDVVIGTEDKKFNLELNAFEAAVLGDVNGSLTGLLNEQKLYAEEKAWDILGNVGAYDVILVNTGKGTKEQFEQLIKESDEHKTSLVFTGTWGVAEGSIQRLKENQGSPEMDQQGYNEGAIYVEAADGHPLFEGINADNNGKVKIHAAKSPYSTFKNYTGIPIASLYVDDESKGDSIAYEYRSKEHMHLLMSSFAVTNIIGPDYGWTQDGKQLFVNALRWSKDADQEIPEEPTWAKEELMVKNEPALIEGSAELGTTINIYEQHGNDVSLLKSVKTRLDGTFSIVLDLDNGSHTLIAEAENFAGKTKALKSMKLIVTGKPE
ncbi:carboxypeptidase regulatory-like domain-containing protein [Mesobacillus subterraneus]|uniref:carboxypeptidase regulatory-like domain-containing protein n=1 Tax=Mesobacillus subterraneus TaxID=285983 RepID=UPI00203DBB8D|nr:carboxypeptidase regulatory-like domain-containing protein [Mesobacillus subterraneus]MCM3664939.1 carboxypeptidase regulatory-like domain-containing protein [Mesobacillus subterraneus]MCM3682027.1 carboxypeptidase regulatory-like domain-containing protein [Mesobacillus subterraneus]